MVVDGWMGGWAMSIAEASSGADRRFPAERRRRETETEEKGREEEKQQKQQKKQKKQQKKTERAKKSTQKKYLFFPYSIADLLSHIAVFSRPQTTGYPRLQLDNCFPSPAEQRFLHSAAALPPLSLLSSDAPNNKLIN